MNAVKPPVNAIETVGEGADLLLIHGTAADKASWNVLIELLRERFRVTTYDRRGTGGWSQAADVTPRSVEEHAADAADTIADRATGPAFVCGVSFGAIVTLELMRRRPDLVRGAVLFEPPLVPREDLAGRRIATLVNQAMDAGRHEVIWNGRTSNGERAAPGVYFYRLLVDGASTAKRLVLR